MALAVRRYNTVRIALWRTSRDSLEATGCHHQASIAADSIKETWLRRFFDVFHRQHVEKGPRLS
jgi:hypothetical protein